MSLSVIMSMSFPCVKYNICYLLIEGQEVNLAFELQSDE